METRLKERLTGAAILVALIVLVVPELFHGQHPDVAATSSSNGEGPPLRSYTIDLSNGPARTAPLQSTDNAGESSAGPSSPSNAQSTPSTQGTPAASAPANSSAAPAVPVAPVARTKPAAPPAAAAPSPAAAKTASASSWSVQLGLFAQRDNAERLMHSAQAKGFPVSVSDADAKGLYHVVATGLADRSAAQTLQGRLQGQGFQAALVAPQSGNLKSQR